LLDRFGLTVDVTASRDPEVRVEVVRRRLAADADPAAFVARWAAAEQELARQISTARSLLSMVVMPDSALRQIAEVCAAFDVDGMRADIVTARAAAAHAAWHGRTSIIAEDVRAAALLALPHRRRRNPFDEPGLDNQALDDALERGARDDGPDRDPDPAGGPDEEPDGSPPDVGSEQSMDGTSHEDGDTADPERAPEEAVAQAPLASDEPRTSEQVPAETSAQASGTDPSRSSNQMQTAASGQTQQAKLIRGAGKSAGTPGRRASARTGRGRTVGSLPARSTGGPIHLSATLAAAAPFQLGRGRDQGRIRLAPSDLRRAERRGKEGNLVLFVVDASGSMAARARMTEIKGAVMSLLMDAYQRRDKVGMITFRDRGAEVILPPTTSVENAARRLETLVTGGRTPLAAGLAKSVQVINAERLRDPLRRPLVLLITDGRADSASALRAGSGLRGHDVVVIDCEQGPVRLRLAERLADGLGAEYLRLGEVTAQPLAGIVADRRAA
jgi:magnesium chelatase subunit D